MEYDITGDTVIYTGKGEEVYSGTCCLEGVRTFQQGFTFSIKSDIWLPMTFDEENFLFLWNLEKYNLNYKRIPTLLRKMNQVLSCDNSNLLVRGFNERGSLQSGFDLYLSSEVILREYNSNPNYKFNIDEYLSKVNEEST